MLAVVQHLSLKTAVNLFVLIINKVNFLSPIVVKLYCDPYRHVACYFVHLNLVAFFTLFHKCCYFG